MTMNKSVDYISIFVRSWQFVRRNRLLWLLGFVAAFGATSLSGRDFNAINRDFSNDFLFVPATFDVPPIGWLRQFDFSAWLPGLVAGLLVVAWLFHFAAQASMIKIVAGREEQQPITVRTALISGSKSWWRLLTVNLLLFGGFYALLLFGLTYYESMFATGPAKYLSQWYWNHQIMDAGGQYSVQQVFGCTVLPINLLALFLYPFLQAAMILEDGGSWSRLRTGWRVFWRNFGRLVPLMIVTLVVVSFIIPPMLSGLFSLLGTVTKGLDPAVLVALLTIALVPFNSLLAAFLVAVGTLLYTDCVRYLKQQMLVTATQHGVQPTLPSCES
jgi:hypothetical protein